MTKFPHIESLGLAVTPRKYNSDSEYCVSADDLEAILAQGVRVDAVERSPGNWYASQGGCLPKSHSALLINIKPIAEPDNFEKITKDFVCMLEDHSGKKVDSVKLYERAKALLEGK